MWCLAKISSSFTLLILAIFSSKKTMSSRLRNFSPPSASFLFLYFRWAVAQRFRRISNSSFFSWKSLQLRYVLKSSYTQPPHTIPINRSTSSYSTPSRYSKALPSPLVRYSKSSLACFPTRQAFSSQAYSWRTLSSSSKKRICRDYPKCKGDGLGVVAFSCSALTLTRALSFPFIILILIFQRGNREIPIQYQIWGLILLQRRVYGGIGDMI